MSKIKLVISGLLLAFSAHAQALPEIQWRRSDLPSAIEESKLAQKPIFFFFYAEWCGVSQRVLRENFHDEALVELINRDFIPVIFEDSQYPDIAREFHINKFPTTMLLRQATGEPIDSLFPNDAAHWLNELIELRDHGRTVSELMTELERDPASLDLKQEIFFKNTRLIRPELAEAMLNRIQQEHPQEYASQEEAYLKWMAWCYYSDFQFHKAAFYYEKLTHSSSSETQIGAIQSLASCFWGLKEYNQVREVLKMGMQRFPEELAFYFRYLTYDIHAKRVDAETLVIAKQGLGAKFPDDSYEARYRFLYAQALEVTGDLSAALAMAEEAVLLDPTDETIVKYRDELKARQP